MSQTSEYLCFKFAENSVTIISKNELEIENYNYRKLLNGIKHITVIYLLIHNENCSLLKKTNKSIKDFDFIEFTSTITYNI